MMDEISLRFVDDGTVLVKRAGLRFWQTAGKWRHCDGEWHVIPAGCEGEEVEQFASKSGMIDFLHYFATQRYAESRYGQFPIYAGDE
jgi:hypothetical protein